MASLYRALSRLCFGKRDIVLFAKRRHLFPRKTVPYAAAHYYEGLFAVSIIPATRPTSYASGFGRLM
jgi:hypothetical protein